MSLVWLIISLNLPVVLCCAVGMVILFVFNLCKAPNDGEYEIIPD